MRMIARRKQHVLHKKPRPPLRAANPDPTRHNPLHAYQAEFLDWSLATGLTESTAAIRQRALELFIRWADQRGLYNPQDITRPILERYQRHLFHYRKANGAPLAFTTQAALLNPLRAFFKWLARDRHILYNPAADLVVPTPPRQLPLLLTVSDIEAVLSQPDLTRPAGLRNRAILETLYSSGLRRSELTRLGRYDVDTERGTLLVRQGKGRKDRLIPVGSRACQFIDRYGDEVRPLLTREPDPGALFLTDDGQAYAPNLLSVMVRRYLRQAGIAHGSCHLFRHAMATHMLDNGADIRFIQLMLGHAKLATTELYTQVSIVKLKEIHTRTHPARLRRRDDADDCADHNRHDRVDPRKVADRA